MPNEHWPEPRGHCVLTRSPESFRGKCFDRRRARALFSQLAGGRLLDRQLIANVLETGWGWPEGEVGWWTCGGSWVGVWGGDGFLVGLWLRPLGREGLRGLWVAAGGAV